MSQRAPVLTISNGRFADRLHQAWKAALKLFEPKSEFYFADDLRKVRVQSTPAVQSPVVKQSHKKSITRASAERDFSEAHRQTRKLIARYGAATGVALALTGLGVTKIAVDRFSQSTAVADGAADTYPISTPQFKRECLKTVPINNISARVACGHNGIDTAADEIAYGQALRAKYLAKVTLQGLNDEAPSAAFIHTPQGERISAHEQHILEKFMSTDVFKRFSQDRQEQFKEAVATQSAHMTEVALQSAGSAILKQEGAGVAKKFYEQTLRFSAHGHFEYSNAGRMMQRDAGKVSVWAAAEARAATQPAPV